MSKPKYKDSMFRDYFNDRVRLLSLCNALLNTNFTNPDELEINTLDGIFFSQIKNDLSCLIENRLIVIVEHQSTVNENMPIRMLFYITELLKLYFKGKQRQLYNEQLIQLPKPEFFVIYNGNAPEEDYRELKLSSAFEGKDSTLELRVKVYNVNAGKNDELLKNCEYLDNYCIFINRVKCNLGMGMDIKEAIVEAVKYCKNINVMKEYLESKEGELIDMVDFEFKIDEEKEALREAAEARGRAEGKAEGRAEGRAEGEIRERVSNLRNIMQTLNFTVQQAMDALKIPQEEREKYASMI